MPKGKPTQYYTSEETRKALVAIGVQHGAKPERAASLGLRIAALHHGRLVEALGNCISGECDLNDIHNAKDLLSEIKAAK